MDVLCDNTKGTVMRASFITDRGRNYDRFFFWINDK